MEREKRRAADKRRRALIVGASIVCVLGLATVVGVLAANAGKSGKSSASGPATAPSGATGKDGLAIPVGKDSAKSTLTVWEDFRCPACEAFETAYRPTVRQLADAGQLKVEYHLVTLIDGNLRGSGSLRAANAAACAQDAGNSGTTTTCCTRTSPRRRRTPSGNDKLIELAGKVDGLTTPTFEKCVKDGTHDSWVQKSNTAFQAGGFSGTPTVLLDGKNVYGDQTMTPAKLKQMVEAANKS